MLFARLDRSVQLISVHILGDMFPQTFDAEAAIMRWPSALLLRQTPGPTFSKLLRKIGRYLSFGKS